MLLNVVIFSVENSFYRFTAESAIELDFEHSQVKSQTLVNSINRIIKDEFIRYTSRMVIVEQSVSNNNYSTKRLHTNDILSELLQTIHNTERISFFVENRIEHNVELRQFILFIIDGYNSFKYERLIPHMQIEQTAPKKILFLCILGCYSTTSHPKKSSLMDSF